MPADSTGVSGRKKGDGSRRGTNLIIIIFFL